MIEAFNLASAVAAGMLLGAVFFGGLWWTVRKAIATRYVALLFLGSMLLRTGIVVLGFYLILGDNWQRLLAGLCGFVIARLIVMRLTRVSDAQYSMLQKARHAP